MATYTVRVGETISDTVLNAAGAFVNTNNWSQVLDANGFDDWTPVLTPGQLLVIPDTLTTDPNTLRQLVAYPSNNASVPDILDKINAVFGLMNPNDWILQPGFWNDAGFWRDGNQWIDDLI